MNSGNYSFGKRQREAEKARKKQEKQEKRMQRRDRGPAEMELTTAEEITAATTYLQPPTVNNILAIEAPSYGRGPYTKDEIEDVLETAFVGFSACKLESESLQTVIHSALGCKLPPRSRFACIWGS